MLIIPIFLEASDARELDNAEFMGSTTYASASIAGLGFDELVESITVWLSQGIVLDSCADVLLEAARKLSEDFVDVVSALISTISNLSQEHAFASLVTIGLV